MKDRSVVEWPFALEYAMVVADVVKTEHARESIAEAVLAAMECYKEELPAVTRVRLYGSATSIKQLDKTLAEKLKDRQCLATVSTSPDQIFREKFLLVICWNEYQGWFIHLLPF